MKKQTIKTPKNAATVRQHDYDKGQVFKNPSETIPGESIGIRELMTRQQAGIPMRGHLLSEATFDDQSRGIDMRKLDFQELFEMKNDLKQKLAQKRQKEEQTRKDQERQALLQEVEEYHLQKAGKEQPPVA